MATVYIYSLIDPRNGEIKYVGKTKDLDVRLKSHLHDAKRTNTPKNAWILKLRRLGLKPQMEMLEEVPEPEWPKAERKWIAKLRRKGCPLKNICDGGEGRNGPLSEETRRKLSKAAKGRPLTESQRKAITKGFRGHKHSEKAKMLLRAKTLGRKHTPEARKKMSLARKGKRKNAEHRGKIGLAHKGRTFSEETRAKMRVSRGGWKPSPELTRIQREKCKGEGNGRAKLTAEQVFEIRERYARGDTSFPKLAEEYPVTFSAIHRIVTGKTWKHLLPQS